MTQQRVGRNDPCPCGSGRKYKSCCAGRRRLVGQKVGGVRVWVLLAIGAAAVAAVVLSRAGNRGGATGTASPRVDAAGGPPAPWTYDPVRNQHYDPAHGHWHDGPPPPGARDAPTSGSPPPPGTPSASGAAPAPWTYDAARNQHWDPTHGHWHQGPPPPGAR